MSSHERIMQQLGSLSTPGVPFLRGATAIQEVAFTLADGIAYVEDALSRGMRFDDFAPRLSFFFNSHNDFFEEIAKFRAARRIWYKLMTERYRAENERSTWMRFHTQTAGVSLTAKLHFGSITPFNLNGAFPWHYSLPAPYGMGKVSNGGYGKYRCFVDFIGHDAAAGADDQPVALIGDDAGA